MVAPQEQIFSVIDFSGGMNTSVSDSRIADNQLSNCYNIDIDDAGSVIARMKEESFITNTGNLVSLVGFYHNATTGLSYLIYYRKNGANFELTAFSSAGATTVIATFGSLTAERQNAKLVEYADIAYIIPGPAGDIYSLTDLVGATIAAAPDLVTATIFKDRLFGAEVNSQRLYFSDVGAFGTWGGSSFIDIDGVDPTPIVAFEILNDVLYIFKQNSIWALYVQGDPVNWNLRNISPYLGAVNRRSTLSYDGTIYFMSFRGFFTTDGLSFENIGKNVLDNELYFDPSPIDLTTCEVFRFNHRIVFTVNNGFHNYVFNTEINAWTFWFSDTAINKYIVTNLFPRGDFKVVPYFLGGGTGGAQDTIRKYNDLVPHQYDAGSTVDNMYFSTKRYDLGYPTLIKKIKFLAVEVSGGLFIEDLTVHVDGASTTVADIDTIDNNSGVDPVLYKYGQGYLGGVLVGGSFRCRTIKLSIRFTERDPGVSMPAGLPIVLGLHFHYEVENRVLGET